MSTSWTHNKHCWLSSFVCSVSVSQGSGQFAFYSTALPKCFGFPSSLIRSLKPHHTHTLSLFGNGMRCVTHWEHSSSSRPSTLLLPCPQQTGRFWQDCCGFMRVSLQSPRLLLRSEPKSRPAPILTRFQPREVVQLHLRQKMLHVQLSQPPLLLWTC